jgi:hypothetical protein
MATPQQKAFCVLRFSKSESVIFVQRDFREQFQSDPPCNTNILRWHRECQDKACICKGESPARRRISEENVIRIREYYALSPRGSREWSMPQTTTVRRVLRKRLSVKAYKFQLLQALKPLDKTSRFNVCTEIHGRMEEDDIFLRRLNFSDEATFHLKSFSMFWNTLNRFQVIININTIIYNCSILFGRSCIFVSGGGGKIRIWAKLSAYMTDICRGFLQPYHENAMVVVSDRHNSKFILFFLRLFVFLAHLTLYEHCSRNSAVKNTRFSRKSTKENKDWLMHCCGS